MESRELSTKITVGAEEAECFFQATAAYNMNKIAPDFIQISEDYANANETNVNNVLIEAHASLLNRESYLLPATNGIQEITRVFPSKKNTNILIDIDDLFRNGIAFFRAATTIAHHANKFQKENYNELFQVFCQTMHQYRTKYQYASKAATKRDILEKANIQLANFNGALATQLIDLGIHKKFDRATAAMRLVHGYQHKMAYPERFCTIITVGTGSSLTKAFYFSKPSTFSPSFHWDSAGWRDAVKKTVTDTQNDWFDKFFLSK